MQLHKNKKQLWKNIPTQKTKIIRKEALPEAFQKNTEKQPQLQRQVINKNQTNQIWRESIKAKINEEGIRISGKSQFNLFETFGNKIMLSLDLDEETTMLVAHKNFKGNLIEFVKKLLKQLNQLKQYQSLIIKDISDLNSLLSLQIKQTSIKIQQLERKYQAQINKLQTQLQLQAKSCQDIKKESKSIVEELEKIMIQLQKKQQDNQCLEQKIIDLKTQNSVLKCQNVRFSDEVKDYQKIIAAHQNVQNLETSNPEYKNQRYYHNSKTLEDEIVNDELHCQNFNEHKRKTNLQKLKHKIEHLDSFKSHHNNKKYTGKKDHYDIGHQTIGNYSCISTPPPVNYISYRTKSKYQSLEDKIGRLRQQIENQIKQIK